jgi:chromate reductase, NAD(P)H dehydrogenase (quinone)
MMSHRRVAWRSRSDALHIVRRVISLLLISGSARDGSTNVAVLRTAAAVAGDDVDAVLFGGIGELPLFNPDDDREGVPIDPRVAAMRTAVAAADALLLCTPEYAGALPAALKNLLEWTIGDAGTYRTPVAWINAAGPAAPSGAADAHESLAKVLRYAGAEIVDGACVRVPVTRDMIGTDGLISDDAARTAIAAAVAALVEHARARAREAGVPET